MSKRPAPWQPDPLKREFAALKAMRTQLVINVTDVEHECAHGVLPFDRHRPCSCWTDGAAWALANRVQETTDFSDAA